MIYTALRKNKIKPYGLGGISPVPLPPVMGGALQLPNQLPGIPQPELPQGIPFEGGIPSNYKRPGFGFPNMLPRGMNRGGFQPPRMTGMRYY